MTQETRSVGTATYSCLAVFCTVMVVILAACTTERPSDDPPLYKASKEGDTATVQKLLVEGADPNARASNDEAEPAIVIAANNGDIGIVQVLLKHGADVNAAGKKSGWNALMRAACTDQLNRITRFPMVILLLKAGADAHSRDRSGQTPLHLACIADPPIDPKVITSLIKHGGDINAKDNYGETPLSNALSGTDRDLQIIKFLIELGARDREAAPPDFGDQWR